MKGVYMERFSVSEIIELAVQTEKLGHEFYDFMSKKYKDDEEISRLLSTLAAQEVLHQRRFSKLKETVEDDITDDHETVEQYLRALVESRFFLGPGKSLSDLEHLRSAQDVLKYALGFEKETLLYYLGLRDIVSGKDVIDAIIDEEKNHIRLLSRMKKQLTENNR